MNNPPTLTKPPAYKTLVEVDESTPMTHTIDFTLIKDQDNSFEKLSISSDKLGFVRYKKST